MSLRPAYTGEITVTDGAEVTITSHSYCQTIYLLEKSTASGWPRAYLIKGTSLNSVQIVQPPGTRFAFPGPFVPGDIAGTVELISNSGDTSTFNVSELSQ